VQRERSGKDESNHFAVSVEEIHMAHGALTMQMARVFHQEFNGQGFDILHDHGERGIDSPLRLGKIRSWFGDTYRSGTILADLDMAVVSNDSDRVYALIEIEETTYKPKVILGDVIATLVGNGIKFQSRRDLQIGKWTTLIVMVHDASQSHLDRIPYLAKQSNYLRENLLTPNASMGRIIIDTFIDLTQLEEKLRQNIIAAINRRGTL
jgi:hypothetical protein